MCLRPLLRRRPRAGRGTGPDAVLAPGAEPAAPGEGRMFLLILIWMLIGAALDWRFGSRRSTSRAPAQARQQMRQEIRY